MWGFNYIVPAAALALLIPLFIHWWNQRQPKRKKVGSIRLYTQSESSKLSAVRFTEVWLWILRSLLILLLIFMLWQPYQRVEYPAQDSLWVLVEPTLKSIIDKNLIADHWRWLSAGFPSNSELIERSNELNYWEILADLNSHPARPKKVIIFTQALPRNYHGQIPTLNYEIEWKIIPTDPSEKSEALVDAIKTKQGIRLFTAIYHPNSVEIKTEDKDGKYIVNQWIKTNHDSIRLRAMKWDTIHLVSDSTAEKEVQLLSKALQLIGKTVLYEQSVSELIPTIFLVNEKPANYSIEKRDVWRNPNSRNKQPWISLESSDSQRFFQLNGRVSMDQQSRDHLATLPEALMKFYWEDEYLQTNIMIKDPRSLTLDQLETAPVVNQSSISHQTLDRSAWLWYLFFTLLIAERMIAHSRKQ